jgi:hypothetical protein
VSVSLEITLDALHNTEPHYRPGDWVRGRVGVLGGGGSRALEVSLHFRERSVDYTAIPRTETSPPIHTGDLSAGQSFDFAIQVPSDALPNCKSEHGALHWELVVKSDQRGLDTKVERGIEVIASRA